MKKSAIFTSLAAFCVAFLLFGQTALASGFVQDTGGIRYQNDDGSFAADTWVQVGSLWYFFDGNGICRNPEGAAAPSTDVFSDNIFEAAGWLPFQTADKNALENGVAAGLVGFDGVQYWAAPAYLDMLNGTGTQTPSVQDAAKNVQAAGQPAVKSEQVQTPPLVQSASQAAQQPEVTHMVWISATGKKYHSKNNCGRMNPAKATQLSLEDALAGGYEKCSKCF